MLRIVRVTGAASTLLRTGTRGARHHQERPPADIDDLAPPDVAASLVGSPRLLEERVSERADRRLTVGLGGRDLAVAIDDCPIGETPPIELERGR